ncbi:class I SAM-dependent methyltransferase [uncultured Agrobacterium sp.]|uniref:class I SAM-dependent methyltransferase n=1 Tax=uncultured Agrobacterium sp. TaxID=157277 RepID=UPI0025D222D8|nr:class I SAM-dependent methyltransferase [uncultured Agrobacterium sp.]
MKLLTRIFNRPSQNRETLYTADFYSEQSAGSRQSAEVISDIVMQKFQPRTVIDIGCGVGTWAAAFASRGCEVTGIDGSYVPEQHLCIPRSRFRPLDLSQTPYPTIQEKYDLVVCLEVIEHLNPEIGEKFLDFITSCSSNVLFSGAIPGQSGVGHVNERWQSYWVAQFAERGYRCLDVIRAEVWNNDRVSPWYAQNAFLFSMLSDDDVNMPIDLVHPKVMMINHTQRSELFGTIAKILAPR